MSVTSRYRSNVSVVATTFVRVATPDAWVEAASANLPTLLVDHANCEKKAASTALALTYKYVDRGELLHKMSRLAREELRHFEQVLELMTSMDIEYVHLSPSRYARELHGLVRQGEPERLIDVLILGAVVEARSCERFVRLASALPENVAGLYEQLMRSEARHYADYMALARAAAAHLDDAAFQARVDTFLDRDAELVMSPDHELRFHSGVPERSTPA